MKENKIKTVIIDDNPFAIKVLQTLIDEHFKEISILATFTNPSKARAFIKKNECDLLLLDVQMPEMSGFELLETLHPFHGKVIFITSHDTFAVQAFRYHALHYLVKPVRLNELKEAIGRISEKVFPAANHSLLSETATQLKHIINKIGLHTLQEMIFVDLNDIIRCQADGAYTKIFLQKEQVLSSKNLKHFEDLLEHRSFFRIHDSHLININHIKKFVKGTGAYVVMNDNSQITISRRKKGDFMNLFE
jgi:two-component system, LytTR family, response regulator